MRSSTRVTGENSKLEVSFANLKCGQFANQQAGNSCINGAE